MKLNYKMKKTIIILIFCLLTANAYAQEISTSSEEVEINETFKINVNIDSPSETIGASFDLRFDDQIIKPLEIREGDFMKKCAKTTFNSIKPVIGDGKIEFRDLCFLETITGEGVIAEVEFTAKSPGKSLLLLENANIFDENGDPMSDVEVINGEVNVKDNEIKTVDVVKKEDNYSKEIVTINDTGKNISGKQDKTADNNTISEGANNLSGKSEESENEESENEKQVIDDDVTAQPDNVIHETKENLNDKKQNNSLLYVILIFGLILIAIIIYKKR